MGQKVTFIPQSHFDVGMLMPKIDKFRSFALKKQLCRVIKCNFSAHFLKFVAKEKKSNI